MQQTLTELTVDVQSMESVKKMGQQAINRQFDQIAKNHDVVFSTDASYKDGIASIAVIDSHGNRWGERIGNYTNHIYGELLAIVAALRLATTLQPLPKRLLIASDCQSILRGVKNKQSHRLTGAGGDFHCLAIKHALSFMYEFCEVKLLWVPGHRGLRLNTAADTCARDVRSWTEGNLELIPHSLRPTELRWAKRETCDLVAENLSDQMIRERDTDQLLRDMELKTSFLNADDHPVEGYPEFRNCELCPLLKEQTKEHVFFECPALDEAREPLRMEFSKFDIPFCMDAVLRGYCINNTAEFIASLQQKKAHFVV